MSESVHAEVMAALETRRQQSGQPLLLPPPAFLVMQGEFLEYDAERVSLTVRFPVLEDHLNPFRSMQGGFIAAALDNTVGPLSMLVAPPSVTRHLEVKYRRAVTAEAGHIRVVARLLEKKKRRLVLEAHVLDSDQQVLASGRATNWIIDSLDR
jgi:uncharacterized protein (TIGR00369 family)